MGVDPKRLSQAEQSEAELRDVLAPALGAFYKGLLAQGFEAPQALVLTSEYMKHVCIRILPMPPPAPPNQEPGDNA